MLQSRAWSSSRRYPAFWFSRNPLGFWIIRLDPEAPVGRDELELSLRVAECYDLFAFPFRSRREARRVLHRAWRHYSSEQGLSQAEVGYFKDLPAK